MRERWFADGYELTQGVVRDVAARDGLYTTPGLTGANVEVAGRDGEDWVPKAYGPGSFALNLWLGADSRTELEAAYDALLLRVSRRHALVRWERHRASGLVQECYGEVVNAITPSQGRAQTMMRLGLEVRVPSGFWQDTTVQDTGLIDLSTVSFPRDQPLPAFRGATAPMGGLVATVTGPVDGLRLVAPETGEWAAFTGALLDGQDVTIDSATSTVTVPGDTPDNLARFTYSGSRFITVYPRPDGTAPLLRVEAVSAGAGASLRLQGRRQYLV